MSKKIILLFILLPIFVAPLITVPSAQANPGHFTLKESSYAPEKVFPGDTNIKLKVVILNSGSNVRDVFVRLSLPAGFNPTYAGSDRASIGDVDEDDEVTLYFYIDIDEQVKPGYFKLPLQVKYDNSGEWLSIPIVVSEKAIFEVVSIETQPKEIHVGDTGVIVRVTLKNTSQVTAESVQVELLIGSAFSGSIIDCLGIINPGETRQATFTIDVDKSASPGQYPTQLTISWTQQGTDQVLTQNLSVTITILPVPLYITILPLLAMIAIVVISVIWLQKKGKLVFLKRRRVSVVS
ncbi:hypothetical protein KEJ26_00155 [Candidatus Bathyarchaeota archaeon]|nr:hypothetical protein [Candidatus Bathyarchaeota archaeon]